MSFPARRTSTYSTALAHGLNPGDNVYINFTAAGSPADGQYQVLTVPDATHFTTIVPIGRQPDPKRRHGLPAGAAAPPALRQCPGPVGHLDPERDRYRLPAYSLAQTPLNSPTVFNFFFPDYKFPGALATAGLTTPEFQLTSDTTVAFQMNFLEGGVLDNTSNTNGISSFSNGGGAIAIDLGPG